MELAYWIRTEKGWRIVESKEEYENFDGTKCIHPKHRSPAWEYVTGMLLQYRYS